MPTWCIVHGCTNSTRKLECNHLSWHSFPKHDETLLTEWLTRVKRLGELSKGNGIRSRHWKVCSEHFDPTMIEKTLTGRRRLRKGAVPTIFDMKEIKRRRLTVEEDERQRMAVLQLALNQGDPLMKDSSQEIVSDLSGESTEAKKMNGLRRVIQELKQAKKSHNVVASETVNIDQNESKVENLLTTNPSAERCGEGVVNMLSQEIEQLKSTLQSEQQRLEEVKLEAEREIARLAEEKLELQKSLEDKNLQLKKALEDESTLRKSTEEALSKELKKRSQLEEELEEVSFNFKSLSKKPKLMHYYSGFSPEEFENFIDFLGRMTCEYLSFENPGTCLLPDDVQVYYGRKLGRPRSLKPKDQLLMSLCRVRLGLSCQDLSARFLISVSQVSRISISFIALMQKRFTENGLWPSDKNIHIHNTQYPETLKPFYPRVRMVIEALQAYVRKGAAKYPQNLSMATTPLPQHSK